MVNSVWKYFCLEHSGKELSADGSFLKPRSGTGARPPGSLVLGTLPGLLHGRSPWSPGEEWPGSPTHALHRRVPENVFLELDAQLSWSGGMGEAGGPL